MRLLLTDTPEWCMITISLQPNEILQPHHLKTVQLPMISMNQGVIIDGRAPIWMHCFLAAHYKPCLWLAISDPKQGGAVVTMTHTPDKQIGEIVSTAIII